MSYYFKGIGILCYYSNGFVQGHCINKINKSCPFSLAGQHLLHHHDPHHNECMDPQDFYKILIQPHQQSNQEETLISLVLVRTRGNEAADLESRDTERKENNDYSFRFETQKFLTGNEALRIKCEYFKSDDSHPQAQVEEEGMVVCIGECQFSKKENET